MSEPVWNGRRWGVVLIILSWVFKLFCCFVVRCQSTSCHGVSRRLTFAPPILRPANDFHHTSTCLPRPRLQHGECKWNALRLSAYLQTCRQLSPWHATTDSYQRQRRRCPSSCTVHYSPDPLPGHYQWRLYSSSVQGDICTLSSSDEVLALLAVW